MLNSGLFLAVLGAALAVGLAGIGSAKGVGLTGEAAAGLLSEKTDMFGKVITLQILPGTQGLYGFIISFMILINIGVLGGNAAAVTTTQGYLYLASSLPIGIGGLISGIAQGNAAVAGISLCAKKPAEFSKAMVSTTLVEIYALLAFIVSLLSVLAVGGMGV